LLDSLLQEIDRQDSFRLKLSEEADR